MEQVRSYRTGILWGLFAVMFGLVPVFMTSTYQLILASHILIWGMFAVAFNLLFGMTGMLSFGQALYYGLGAYFVGLMVHYLGSGWFLPGMLLGIMASAVLSFLLGLLIIRVHGVFFTMLTLAFAQLVWQITFKWYEFTGGDDGVQGVMAPGILGDQIVYFYFTLVLCLLSIWAMKRLAYSPLGLILRCVRQNPERVRFLGRRVKWNRLRVYMVSSVFAALAGGLMAGMDNSIHTDMLYWTTSGEVILMSVLGGIHQFFGPFIGAAAIILIEDVVGAHTEYWAAIIGGVMLIMVIAFPKGIVGEVQRIKSRFAGSESRRV